MPHKLYTEMVTDLHFRRGHDFTHRVIYYPLIYSGATLPRPHMYVATVKDDMQHHCSVCVSRQVTSSLYIHRLSRIHETL